MNLLRFNTCQHVTKIEWPQTAVEITLVSKAITLVTDFQIHRPRVIDFNTKAVEAEYSMKKTHVKLKLVLDKADNFLGTVSYNDLNNQEIIKQVAAGNDRADLRVSDFMKHKEQLPAIDWRLLENATVRAFIHFIADCNEQHILVTDNDGQTVRGIVSASDIARVLNLDVNLANPVSFKRICREVIAMSQNAA